MDPPKPTPLFPTYLDLIDHSIHDFPEVSTFLDDGQAWRWQHWSWAASFLMFLGRNKSRFTYFSFRIDIERFLLWSFLFKDKPIGDMKKKDILEFADFTWNPPINWISTSSSDRFMLHKGSFLINPKWRPYVYKQAKFATSEPDKRRYKQSQQTLQRTFAVINSFYIHLIQDEVCFRNSVPSARRDCKYFIKDAQVKQIKRLTIDQWKYLLETTKKIAEEDSNYERTLFIIVSLKVLFLRISELSERPTWSPMMKHFWRDTDGNWWLKIYGKGRKIRDITVPTSYLAYLKRYREFRGLSELPCSSDDSPIVSKFRGQGGMESRQLSRIVEIAFNRAYERMKKERGEFAAQQLQEASTHWLRHTGASMEIERGRPLKDLSEDLGHSSMLTTDKVYVQTDSKQRALSGKDRKV